MLGSVTNLYTPMADPTPKNKYLKKDSYYLETFVLPGEITSMAVGRFFNQNVETLIIAKVYSYPLVYPILNLPSSTLFVAQLSFRFPIQSN